MVLKKTQNLRANLSLNGHSTKTGITYWIWSDFGFREVLIDPYLMYLVLCEWELLASQMVLYAQLTWLIWGLVYLSSLSIMTFNFLKIGTQGRVLFSLLNKMRICRSRLPFVMIQSSWIKLIKENIIEVKEKYEQGLKKGTKG